MIQKYRNRMVDIGIVLLFWGLLWAVCVRMVSYTDMTIGNEVEVVEAIRTAMQHRSKEATVRFRAWSANQDKVKKLMDHLVKEAYRESDDPRGGDYLRFQIGGYELRHTMDQGLFKYDYTIRLLPTLYTTAEQEEEVDERVNEVLEELDVGQGAGDFEKTCAVRDFVYDTVEYDVIHKKQKDSHLKTTAYAALFYHRAVCQGYAVLGYRLLKELGVDTRVVTGEARVDGNWERHAWNLVFVDENYYNMDLTLDKITESDAYFLKSDDSFAKDHRRDEEYRTKVFYQRYPMGEVDYSR